MIPSKKSIEKEIKRLRAIVETETDPVVVRIAYTVAESLRWSIEDTAGWLPPSKDVYLEADILKKELSTQPA